MTTFVDRDSPDPRGFVGEYRGIRSAGPCSAMLPGGAPGVSASVISAGCVDAGNCGLAVAPFVQPDLTVAQPPIAVTTLCVVGARLYVDLDGDGAVESFPLDRLQGSPAIAGRRATHPPCKQPVFAWYRQPLKTSVLDVLGAADLDRDGRFELMVAVTRADKTRAVSVYTPAPGRYLVRAAVADW